MRFFLFIAAKDAPVVPATPMPTGIIQKPTGKAISMSTTFD